jgi:hypothetical protein
MAKFTEINPNTKKVWRLQELHDAYSDSQLHVIALQGTVSELETKVGLKYNWSTICKAAQSLASERAKADTKKVTRSLWKDAKSVYSELSFELVNHPTK